MFIERFYLVSVALLAAACAGPLYADSYYPLRPEDPRAVYLAKDQFEVHADGIDDDASAVQQAIDRVQETTRIGVVFIPEGRYRIGKTVNVWAGIRLIGYGQNRPVFVLRIKLGSDERLTTSVFAERGGTSVIDDASGNVYIAGDQVYIYSRGGKQHRRPKFPLFDRLAPKN